MAGSMSLVMTATVYFASVRIATTAMARREKIPRENSDKLNALFDAANRHSRMSEIYADYLQGWKAQGGTLMCHFSDCVPYTKWGRWGTLEWVGQKPEEAPKYSAIVDFTKTHERWWQNLGQQAGALGE